MRGRGAPARGRSRAARGAAVAAACAWAACGGAEAGPLPRIVDAAPAGTGVPTTSAVRVRFSAPVDPAGLLDGSRLVLAEAGDLARALAAVDAEEGARGLGLPARAALDAGGAAVTLRPDVPLRAHLGHVVVVSSRLRAADGRPVLDPEGRHRAFVASFETGAGQGPPPVPAVTEVRAVADAPEPGGEYVEVANLGAGALDLRGWRLGKRTGTGAQAWCTIDGAPADAVAPGGVALVAGGAWDGRYALPPGVPVLRCGASALAGGLADDRAPAITLVDPAGEVVATLGEGGGPRCPVAVERVVPAGPDAAENLVCTGGSPGYP